MSKVTFDYSKAQVFIRDHEMEYMKGLVSSAKDVLVSRTGAGNDFLGWIDLPVDYDKEEFARIKAAAKKIQEDSEVLLVIGIGGSYLGARAAVEFLRHGFYNQVSKEIRRTPEIYFVGNSISSSYIKGLIDVIGDRDFSVNMISKSGTTTEPAIAFRVFKEMLEKKYGKEGAAKRIYATTDKARGALKKVADEEGYEEFVVPDNIGGRFSVLTAVGLLPIAVAGVDIDEISVCDQRGGIARDAVLLTAHGLLAAGNARLVHAGHALDGGRATEHLIDLLCARERVQVAPDGGFAGVQRCGKLRDRGGALCVQTVQDVLISFLCEHNRSPLVLSITHKCAKSIIICQK